MLAGFGQAKLQVNIVPETSRSSLELCTVGSFPCFVRGYAGSYLLEIVLRQFRFLTGFVQCVSLSQGCLLINEVFFASSPRSSSRIEQPSEGGNPYRMYRIAWDSIIYGTMI